MTGRSPQVLYIGYQKTGSALLRSYFEFHPDIFWTRNANYLKYTDYKVKQKRYVSLFPRNITERVYIDVFEGLATGVLINESHNRANKRFTPYHPMNKINNYQDVSRMAGNISQILPNVKILISIRNQITWLASNWAYFISRLPERSNAFSDFLNTYEGKSLLFSGQYHVTIKAFQHYFGANNVYVIPLEELGTNLPATLKKMCAFLEITYRPFSQEHWNINKGRDIVDLAMFRHFSTLSKTDFARRIYRFLKPLKNYLRMKPVSDDLDPETKKILNAFYASSNLITSELTGLDLRKFGYPT